LLIVWKNPTAPVKRGSSRRIEMNMFNPLLNITFKLTYLIYIVNKKNKEKLKIFFTNFIENGLKQIRINLLII